MNSHKQMMLSSLEEVHAKLIVLSTGLMGLTVTFRGTLVGETSVGTWLLGLAWVALSACVLVALRFQLSFVTIHSILEEVERGRNEIESGRLDDAIRESVGELVRVADKLQGDGLSLEKLERTLVNPQGGRFERDELRAIVDEWTKQVGTELRPAIERSNRAHAKISGALDVALSLKTAPQRIAGPLQRARQTSRWAWGLFCLGFLSVVAFGLLNLR